MITIGCTLDIDHPGGQPPQVSQDHAYIRAIEAAGAVPLVIPPLRDPAALRRLYDLCDAICMPGGPDVNPDRYDAEPHPATRPIATAVEVVEIQVLTWALADNKPVLAVCRGMQLLNVLTGGSLIQHLDADSVDHRPTDRAAIAHPISITAGSRFHRIVGETRLEVNSYHHQAIDRLGNDLVITATSDDGIAEVVEMPSRDFVLAIQFHPEVLIEEFPWALNLFTALTDAARTRLGETA